MLGGPFSAYAGRAQWCAGSQHLARGRWSREVWGPSAGPHASSSYCNKALGKSSFQLHTSPQFPLCFITKLNTTYVWSVPWCRENWDAWGCYIPEDTPYVHTLYPSQGRGLAACTLGHASNLGGPKCLTEVLLAILLYHSSDRETPEPKQIAFLLAEGLSENCTARNTVSQKGLLVEEEALPVGADIAVNKHPIENILYF